MGSWRARCGESRTPGSEGGPGKRTSRETGTAPRPDPYDLTDNQTAKLAWVARANAPLYRAYLLKEQLRVVFQLKDVRGIALLGKWLGWASRCKIPAFVDLARTIRKHREAIEAALTNGLSNARVEAVNTKIRLLQRVAFGYRDPEALIAMAMLDLGGCCPDLPGRPEAKADRAQTIAC
jgi:transposase